MTGLLEKTLSHLADTLEQAEQKPSAFSNVDPRVKVMGALLLTIAAVSSTRLPVLIFLLLVLTVTGRVVGVSWSRLVSAWAGGLFFAAVVAVPAVFTSGWRTALLLVLRSETSLTCWVLLIMTTPFQLVLRALRTLYVPVAFIAILGMTFRYIFLLVRSAQDMLLSRRSRIAGRMNGADHRRLFSATTGVLLSKSIQMSDEVYHAMASRGFRGEIHVLEDFQMRAKDWLVLSGVGMMAAIVLVVR